MAETKYYGKYRAIVVDNDDPERRGRIRVQCPTVLGVYKSAWCEPCIPYATDFAGDYYVPPLNEAIWVEFEEGDVDKPIWNGGWYKIDSSPLLPESNPEDYRFISFKNSILRMGDKEFIFELRDGDTSDIFRVDSSTVMGLTYIGSKSEEELRQIDTICIENYTYFTEEVPNILKELADKKLDIETFVTWHNNDYIQHVEDMLKYIDARTEAIIEDVNETIQEWRDFLKEFSDTVDEEIKRLDGRIDESSSSEDLTNQWNTIQEQIGDIYERLAAGGL